MITQLLLKEDFFHDDGDLTPGAMATLVSRITDKECGVAAKQIPLAVSTLIPVQRYKGRYYHVYRSLHQLLSQRYTGLTTVPPTDADVIYTQADLFDALELPMTKENVMNNVI